jgi:hypothetical protein
MHAAFGNNTKDAVTPGVKQKKPRHEKLSLYRDAVFFAVMRWIAR